VKQLNAFRPDHACDAIVDDPIFDANQDEHPPAGHDINVWPLGLLRERQGDQEMSNTPHTLRDEFPDQMEAIHALKITSPEFARILDEYDEVNDRVHRAEARIEPVSEEAEVDLRKQRLLLKDKIASALSRR
jgi:uncharacterized protein YdcH (DUF465 family)